MRLRISALLLLTTGATLAQRPTPAFEVASVKPNRTTDPGSSHLSLNHSHFRAENFSLRSLIAVAYDVRDTQLIGAPAWAAIERWDVNATPASELASGEAGNESMRAMLRTLLAERFHLTVHKEQRETSVYALAVAKGGPRLTASAPGANSSRSSGNGTIRFTSVPLSELAGGLTAQLGRTVIDETGISGKFDFKLEFAPESAQEVDRPDLFTAVQEQLGLKLESRKARVGFIVIDKAERAKEN